MTSTSISLVGPVTAEEMLLSRENVARDAWLPAWKARDSAGFETLPEMCGTRLVGQVKPCLLIARTDLRVVLRRRATATPRCNACIGDLALQKRCRSSTTL
jgi:hypothetical protein